MNDLRALLSTLGVTEEEIAAAEAEGPDALRLLALDRVLLPYPNRYTEQEVAELAGVPLDMARRLWRAMGFVDPAPDEAVFTDADVETLGAVRELLEEQLTEPLLALQLTRVMGLSMARVAEAVLEGWRNRRILPLRETEDDLEIDQTVVDAAQKLLGNNERFLTYIWRRHLAATAKRVMAAEMGEGSTNLGIGFADLVGFTAVSQRLEERELARLVERFETGAHDTITSLGGRLVKMIGDEVMFVAGAPDLLARIGFALSGRHEEDEQLPSLRVGLAWGPVLAREGDYYGATVNRANRIVKAALPGTVLVDEPIADALQDDAELYPKRIPPPVLKGIGRVQLWTLRPDRNAESEES